LGSTFQDVRSGQKHGGTGEIAFAGAFRAEAVDADAEKFPFIVEDRHAGGRRGDFAEEAGLVDHGNQFTRHHHGLAVEFFVHAAEHDDIVQQSEWSGVFGIDGGEVGGRFFRLQKDEVEVGVFEHHLGIRLGAIGHDDFDFLDVGFGGNFHRTALGVDGATVHGIGEIERAERSDDEAFLGEHGADDFDFFLLLLGGVAAGGELDVHHGADKQRGVFMSGAESPAFFLEGTGGSSEGKGQGGEGGEDVFGFHRCEMVKGLPGGFEFDQAGGNAAPDEKGDVGGLSFVDVLDESLEGID